MKSLNEIKSILEKNKSRLFHSYPIKSLAIFGSFARNEGKKNSDLDVLVEFNDKIGIRFIDLANELEKLIGLKIDLVSRKGVKERYFKSIEEDLIYIFKR
ncbi:nucleotidyltransferase [Muricauda sp. HICW]|uniref:Nucleotidyltransferase n=1 Tax=Flagellimonas chongwuensis TaxID=2697365 RepID=A0A850NLC6_9FLAO|nr:nucleotidyltransferase family protein [Allomuricauda chongwuensis]NVN18077.1 nucleotidyltransferase [Allomuricauda chongwuensis]